jgi:hypothetical protein
VGVFVLERSFHEAWGNEASEKISKFSNYLAVFHVQLSVCLELHNFLFVDLAALLKMM